MSLAGGLWREREKGPRSPTPVSRDLFWLTETKYELVCRLDNGLVDFPDALVRAALVALFEPATLFFLFFSRPL